MSKKKSKRKGEIKMENENVNVNENINVDVNTDTEIKLSEDSNNITNEGEPTVEPTIEPAVDPEVKEDDEPATDPEVNEDDEPATDPEVNEGEDNEADTDNDNESNSGSIVVGVVSKCSKLNVRKEPKKDSEVICVLAAGTELTVDPELSTEDFYKVYTSVKETLVEGYCVKEFIENK